MKKKFLSIVFAFVVILPCLLLLGGCNNTSKPEDNKCKLTFALENWEIYDESTKEHLYFIFQSVFANNHSLPSVMNFIELKNWTEQGNEIELEAETNVYFYITSNKGGLNVQYGICEADGQTILNKSSYYSPHYGNGYYINYTHSTDTVLKIDLTKVTN